MLLVQEEEDEDAPEFVAADEIEESDDDMEVRPPPLSHSYTEIFHTQMAVHMSTGPVLVHTHTQTLKIGLGRLRLLHLIKLRW